MIFHDIGLIGASLDFPYSQKQLSRCQEVENEHCLKTYERVKSAKKRLFESERKVSLQATLNAISQECDSDEITTSCRGAIIALYFFSSSEEDAAIRKYLSTVSRKILVKTYEVDNTWLTVSHDKALWREWIIESSKLTSEEKAAFLRNLSIEKQVKLTIDQL
jgi:urate oxidase